MPDKWPQTRRQKGYHGGWPDINGFEYLFDYLTELGTVQSTGDSIKPLSFAEIQAYSQAVQPLSAWDVVTLSQLSQAYLSGWHSGKDPASPAPWFDPDKVDHEAVQQDLDSFFDTLLAKAVEG